MARAKQFPEFDPVAMDALIGTTQTPEDLSALFRFMQKRLAERILAGELTEHSGYAAGEDKPAGQANYRNGTTPRQHLAHHDCETLTFSLQFWNSLGRKPYRTADPTFRFSGSSITSSANRSRSSSATSSRAESARTSLELGARPPLTVACTTSRS